MSYQKLIDDLETDSNEGTLISQDSASRIAALADAEIKQLKERFEKLCNRIPDAVWEEWNYEDDCLEEQRNTPPEE